MQVVNIVLRLNIELNTCHRSSLETIATRKTKGRIAKKDIVATGAAD